MQYGRLSALSAWGAKARVKRSDVAEDLEDLGALKREAERGPVTSAKQCETGLRKILETIAPACDAEHNCNSHTEWEKLIENLGKTNKKTN